MDTILVTGSAGFIGRALVSRLRVQGFDVLEFDREQGDLTSPDALAPYHEREIAHVFHVAGKTFVPESWRDPVSFYQTNVMGTINVLEFCRRTGARSTYLSSYLYGEPQYLPVDEDHPLRAQNPYSQSKLLADGACRFYAQELGLPLTIFRPFNVYGPGQSPHFLLPEIIRQVMDPSTSTVEVKDLRPRRDFVFIEDLVDALILSIHGRQGIYNVAGGFSQSVEEIVLLVLQASGVLKEYRSQGAVRRNEILELYADISRIRRELSWSPKTTLAEGIRRCLQMTSSSG